MLRKEQKDNRKIKKRVSIDDMTPQDHILRDIEKAIDFSFIYDEVKWLYSAESGRPALDPVVLFKIVLIQYTFGIRSMYSATKTISCYAQM